MIKYQTIQQEDLTKHEPKKQNDKSHFLINIFRQIRSKSLSLIFEFVMSRNMLRSKDLVSIHL